MKKNGFTLVELLAVIVILAILMTIVGVSLSEPKKEAHVKEVQKMEETIKSLGADFYLDNRKKFSDSKKYKVSLTLLKNYLKNIECNDEDECFLKNPVNNETCEAYLLIDTNNSKDMFSSYIDCGDLYRTSKDLTDYKEINSLD